ncbi:helix-turn-helix domain-containing protein [Levilactobacillus hammesii]|uniref:HTH cro/C1-type domain-containing protein n=1 Tax=Levilactobacillus hammesii DSM 16381 TaxID=1423753 RepID=A0A0R1UKB4_9LACO|nr:helix-turn-helix transcriptional regulator [Levilactobacillus hammesii]KRL93705.1 hypothetical protein FD28_GL000890 [Levilactobacillus hammesii DSM 16381]
MPEVVAQKSFTDKTGSSSRYSIVAVTETSLVANEYITSQHHYWIPATAEMTNRQAYLEPLDDPTYNIRQDWMTYRQQFNFLQPTEIKAAREKLGLTLREAALVLGMSFSTLSNIENGRTLQSFDHEIKLRYLTRPTWLRTLVRHHRALILTRSTQRHVDAKRLFAKLR